MDSAPYAIGSTTRIGQQWGNYRIVGLLGRGGFATVYLGEHSYLGTQAAVKILYPRLITTQGRSFHAEARISARLSHAHVVRVLEYGFQSGMPYLVMEYAPDGSLARLHPKGQILPLDLVVRYARQTAKGLYYIHTSELIHRDIKPQNLLLDRQRRVLVSDLGIAIAAQGTASFREEFIPGTPTYMAPEQIMGHPCFASDQYALAVVIYEWLCGAPPFQGTSEQIAEQHLRANPPSLRQRVPSIPPAVEQVVMRGLAKRPSQRYGDVLQFAAALQQAAEESAVEVRNVPLKQAARPAQSPARSARRQPHRSHKRTPRWLNIAALSLADVLLGIIFGAICFALHVPAATTWWLLSFWFTGFAFVRAFTTRNQRAFTLACCVIGLALLVGLAFRSMPAFMLAEAVLFSLSSLLTLIDKNR